MKKLGRILRAIVGVFCAIATVVYIVTAVTDPEQRVLFVVLAVIFGALAYLLLHQKKVQKAEPVRTGAGTYTPDAPEEILQDMQRYYTKEQVENDVRIMSESFKLAQQTSNIDTFTSRLELARKKALTLLQAEKAGCKGVLPGTSKACEEVLSSAQSLKISFLENSYIKETTWAMTLKTPSGQRKRLEAYLAKLASHKSDFLDVEDTYDKVVNETRALMP